MKRLLICGAAIAMTAAAASARPVSLALWTFDVTPPVGPGPITADSGLFGGTSDVRGNTGGTYDNPVGNGTAESYSCNNWNVGEFWEFRSSSTGYNMITISWSQTSSNTGPRDFDLQLSTNGGGSYSTVASYMVLPNATTGGGPWSSGTNFPVYNFSYSLGVSSDNLADLRIRFTNTSTVSANLPTPGTVAATGTDRIDGVHITGELIPAPGALVLAGFGGFLALRRRR